MYKFAALALAASAVAVPNPQHHHHKHFPFGGFFGGSASGSAAAPTFIIPTGTAPVAPVGTGASSPPYPTYVSNAGNSTSGSDASSSSSAAAATTSAASLSSGSSTSGGDLPASSGSSALSAVQTIAAGESFDGGMVMFDRGVSCTGQDEGGDSDAVFEIEEGGSLSNVIIGPNQIEGVHCFGACTLTNVWWSAVCEDAFTVKEQSDGDTTTITGGGAFGAEDKVLQHNGGGTISVSGFTVDTFGKLYRSCGNCDTMYERHVIMDDITATSGSELAGKRRERSLPLALCIG